MKEPMGSIVGGKNSLSKEAGLLLRESSILYGSIIHLGKEGTFYYYY